MSHYRILTLAFLLVHHVVTTYTRSEKIKETCLWKFFIVYPVYCGRQLGKNKNLTMKNDDAWTHPQKGISMLIVLSNSKLAETKLKFGHCKSQWSHISFIRIRFTDTEFWVPPVSIRPQSCLFITIKEVLGARAGAETCLEKVLFSHCLSAFLDYGWGVSV